MKQPQEFKIIPEPTSGRVNAQFNCCDIEGRRSVHIDLYSEKTPPYGHLFDGDVDNLIDWLKRAKRWMATPTKDGAE